MKKKAQKQPNRSPKPTGPYMSVENSREYKTRELQKREVGVQAFRREREREKMEDSGAILCQISSLKDMLDQVFLRFASGATDC